MADLEWNPDLFCTELTAKLVEAISPPGHPSHLARGVELSSAAAEGVCHGRPHACGAGCPHCCVLNVAILIPEAMVIAGWLNSTLAANEYDALKKLLATHGSWGRWMEDEERIARRTLCPMLDKSSCCSIHAVRPLACRGVASLDSNRCKEAFDPIISDQDRSVPADLLRRSAYDTAFKALARALKHHGLDDRSIELGVGVLAMMEHPGYHLSFLKGERLPHRLWE
jgi:Fe-S-cluster containining protein